MNNRFVCNLAIVIALTLLGSVRAANAEIFEFTIINGEASYVYDREQIPGGEVTGLLYGLTDNSWSEPTAVYITYADPGLGFTIGTLTSLYIWGGTGFQVTNGQITDANFDANFDDAAGQPFQLRLNDQEEVIGANWLFWNGGSTPVTAVANTLGFEGATYENVSFVPEPSTWAMMLVGFAGIGFAGYRASRRSATS
jgi:hypothetical protein